MTDSEVPEHVASNCDAVNWDASRKESLQPFGFGDRRKNVWPRLLHVGPTQSSHPPAVHEEPFAAPEELNATRLESLARRRDVESHRDERQIGLDTDRSFVLYPVDDGPDRDGLKQRLHELIVSVFRKRRRLNYFQGYHDIVSVMFLTLPKEVQVACVEKLSLQRLRDAMGMTLEPVVGLLRIQKRLLHEADADFAAVLERTSPLPYFALSNILTLMSHEVPTLPLIQHIFDYLLCRHPIVIVYLVTAVILARRDEVRQLIAEDDEGMIHSVLSTLPDLYEEDENAFTAEITTDGDIQDLTPTNDSKGRSVTEHPSLEDDSTAAATPSSPMSDVSSTVGDDESMLTTVGPDSDDEDAIADKVASPSTLPLSPAMLEEQASTLLGSQPEDEPASTPEERPSSRTSFTTQSEHVPPRPRISITSLLMQADDLYARFPPSHPSIALSSIMGPQSVMLTWREDPSELPPDDDAELMVGKPELIVLPYIEPDDEVDSDDSDASPRGKRRSRANAKEREERARRKLKKPRHLVLQRKTMVAGAVLVLGVAMAVYGLQGGGSASLFRGFADPHQQRHSLGTEWRRMSRFVGGVVIGVGERILEPLLH